MKIRIVIIGLVGWALVACSLCKPKKSAAQDTQQAQDSAQEFQMKAALKKEFNVVKEELKHPKHVAVSRHDASRGAVHAPVTIVEWADFNCGYCEKMQGVMQKIDQQYGKKIRVVYKQLPILAPESRTAAQYMEAIALHSKSKAVQFHDLIYANQNEFRMDAEKFLDSAVKKVGANLAQVKREAHGHLVKSRIAADMAEAKKFGFTGTPGFMVNGAAIRGAYPYQLFQRVIDYILKTSKKS